jgi:hypothetical protein
LRSSQSPLDLTENLMLYLDIPTADDYADLAAFRGDMAVSIVLPTTPVTEETDADRIQLKNLIKEADGRVTCAEAAGAGSYGVADEVARRVLLSGGEVFSVRAEDMPEPGKPVAAMLRFPL